MEDLAVFTALNHSGSFGKNFVKFKKKICYLPAKGRSVWWKTVTLFTIRTSQPANNIHFALFHSKGYLEQSFHVFTFNLYWVNSFISGYLLPYQLLKIFKERSLFTWCTFRAKNVEIFFRIFKNYFFVHRTTNSQCTETTAVEFCCSPTPFQAVHV